MATLQLSGYERFSSTVRLELHADGRVFNLAGIGPNEIIPRDTIDLNPCDAEIFMDVDGQSFVWSVTLNHGAVPFDGIIEIEPRGEIRRMSTIEG